MIDACVTRWYLTWIRREALPDPLPELAQNIHTPVPLRDWLKAGVRPSQIMDLVSYQDKLDLLNALDLRGPDPHSLIADLAKSAETSPEMASRLYKLIGHTSIPLEKECVK